MFGLTDSMVRRTVGWRVLHDHRTLHDDFSEHRFHVMTETAAPLPGPCAEMVVRPTRAARLPFDEPLSPRTVM